jgi:hypothetical protein
MADASAGTATVSLTLIDGDAGIVGYGANNASPSPDYVLVQILSSTSSVPNVAQIGLGSTVAPGDYYVDAVRVFRQIP